MARYDHSLNFYLPLNFLITSMNMIKLINCWNCSTLLFFRLDYSETLIFTHGVEFIDSWLLRNDSLLLLNFRMEACGQCLSRVKIRYQKLSDDPEEDNLLSVWFLPDSLRIFWLLTYSLVFPTKASNFLGDSLHFPHGNLKDCFGMFQDSINFSWNCKRILKELRILQL